MKDSRLLAAAKLVIDSWESGDLAGAVNQLTKAVEEREAKEDLAVYRVLLFSEDLGTQEYLYHGLNEALVGVSQLAHSAVKCYRRDGFERWIELCAWPCPPLEMEESAAINDLMPFWTEHCPSFNDLVQHEYPEALNLDLTSD